ncbi:hypothetical protein AVEN_209392-1 [Araneus ventricosus]|uniref:Uncharacterized protein n=1 Tax=Araneus ventricosus TaxID=182803 RepID=A0A4Y2F0C7_ARAVE|nr:hypothetical protein AVEN_22314-1 [Araneus ventricosus]GBM34925.1 hypothetical protein AVEN_55422-1 [Araneus ventricosus]GBM34980.1 hypothetical protein AVEN_139543-1 [Araneus ventricosus]GBM35017.1 hypothetical protein AVEN_209392-1 [Araneus ventricosus]
MSSSMGIHSSYFSSSIPLGGSMTFLNGHVPARYMGDLQREVMKNKTEILGMCGGKCPHMFPYKSSEKFYEVELLTLVENEGLVNSLL